MAHIILTGATGLVGAAALQYCLDSPEVAKVSILTRRPVALAKDNPKANVILHQDFNSYPQELLDQLKDATACIWAQGITSRGMNQADYEVITIDYPLAAAKALAANAAASGGEDSKSGKMNFVYMSAAGAELVEKEASMMFAKVKGRAEAGLLELQKQYPGFKAYSLRPAIINPQGQVLAEREKARPDWMKTFFGNLAEKFIKKIVIPNNGLAKALTILALGDGEPLPPCKGLVGDGRVLENEAIRKVAGLPI